MPSRPSSGTSIRTRWQKVLYLEQGPDDCFTGPSFLEDMVVNATVPERAFRAVAAQALDVNQQLASLILVAATSLFVCRGCLSDWSLLGIDGLLALGGFLLSALAGGCAKRRAQKEARATSRHSTGFSPSKAKPSKAGTRSTPFPSNPGAALCRMLALALAVGLLSPLYATLTQSTSSDSILAIATALGLANLYLHSYHFSRGLTAGLSGSLALGAALAASILIASRLPSIAGVAALMLMSMEVYVLAPYLRRQIRSIGVAADALLTGALVVAAGLALSQLSRAATAAYVFAALAIGLVFPLWMVRVHKFKAQINGPWDEAVPKLGDTLVEEKED